MTETIEWLEYLRTKRLGDGTINQYFLLFKHFQKYIRSYGLKQNIVNRFILKHPSNVTRSFLKNYFEYYGIKDFVITKQTGRKEKKKKMSISSQEMRVLREELYRDDFKFGLLLDLSYFCALRKSEALGIVAERFDWQRWNKDRSKPCRLVVHGKGKKDRLVIVPPLLTKQIGKYINALDYLAEGEQLFKVSHTTWTDHFKKVVREKLKKDYTLHDLRRSRATNWYAKGDDLIKIKTKLGHASISTTQLYINPDEEKALLEWEEEY